MSNLIAQIQQEFNTQDFKVVSFDLFDTIIFRKVSQPTDIFSLAYEEVAHLLSLPIEGKEFEKLRISAEKHAKKDAPCNEVTLNEIYSCLPFSAADKALLLNAELQVESAQSFLFEPMLALINWFVERHVKVLFLSDMYLSQEQIHKVFFKTAPELIAIPLFVSSQRKANKSSGKLFDLVKNEFSLNFLSWMHIGDNKHSDFDVPQRLGIHSVHTSGCLDSEQILKIEALCCPISNKFNAVRQLAAMHKPDQNLSSNEAVSFELGALIWGPALLSFADWVIDKSITVQSNTILCLMREAEVFEPLIKKRLGQRGISHIDVKKLYASRKSTFWPSIDTSVDKREWVTNLVQRLIVPRGYTVHDFYMDLRLEKDEMYQNYHQSLVKNTDGLFYKGQNILNCLTELAIKNAQEVENFIQAQKTQFLKYYHSNIGTSYQQCVVVDLGNGGTIQSQIQSIFNQACSANLLFYSSNRVYRFAQSVVYSSFLNESYLTSKMLSRSPECIEAFLVGDCGTTLSYSDDEKATPIQAEKLHENSSLVQAFMGGLNAYFTFHHKLKFKNIGLEEANAMLLRYVQYPTPKEAELFTHVYHQDNFGSENTYPIVTDQQLGFVKEYGLEQVFMESSRYTRWKVGSLHWPQALLNLSSDKFMQKHHGLVSMDTEHDVIELVERIKASGCHTFSVYGAGVFFDELLPYVTKHAWKVEHLIDRHAEISGAYEKSGFQVLTLDQALEIGCSKVVICSKRFKDEIAKNIYAQSQKYQCEDIEIISL